MNLQEEIQEFIDRQVTRCSDDFDDPTELLERVKIELIRLAYNDNWAKQQDELLHKLLTKDKK